MAEYDVNENVVTEEVKAKKIPDLDGIAGAVTLVTAGGVAVKGGELLWKKVVKPGMQKLAAKVMGSGEASEPAEAQNPADSGENVNAE